MNKYDINADEANKLMTRCDEMLEGGGDLDGFDPMYVRGVKDTLGYLLGYYDDPFDQ